MNITRYILGTMTTSSMVLCFLIGTALVLMGAYSMIRIGTTLTPRTIYVNVVLFTFDVFMFYVVFEACSAVYKRADFSTAVGRWYGNMEPHYRLLLMIVLLVIGILRLGWVFKTIRTTITQFSVGETLDLIPLGVSFSNDYGQIMHSNNMIDELSYWMTGTVLSDEKDFWDKITSGDLVSGTLVNSDPETPVVKMPDGKIWLLTKTRINSALGEVSQILAVDATAEERLSQELNESNDQLRDMNMRLRRYHEEVDDTVRSEELLEAKMRVHDKMGETLIAAKMFLTNPESPVNGETVLKSWMEDLALLREESKEDEAPKEAPKQVERFMAAAKHLGIDLIINGEMPENRDTMNLICVGIQECMTNAIQHAEADRMEVTIDKDDFIYTVNYTNNGKTPNYPIKEGGGMKLLRETANKMGATMNYGNEGNFSLTLKIPRLEE